MSLLFRILYAVHARGTHHKLALDALTHVRAPEAERWQRLFLSFADRYMEGAKAPDDIFKDFKNHVLHPRDGYWGGAPAMAEKWYGALVAALATEDWSEAAWCAGVLSHYVTDPLHPFHTGQSPAENDIHRAVEWSISKSYNELRREGLAAHPNLDVVTGSGSGWLPAMLRTGADRANGHYEALIAHYDFTRGVVDPPSGLDIVGRRIVAELLIYASVAVARVLERAIAEAGTSPPDVSLTSETVLATLQIPKRLLLKKIADTADRRQVEAMYDELVTTGRVEKTLPEDDAAVSRLHAAEVGRRMASPSTTTPAVAPADIPTASAAPARRVPVTEQPAIASAEPPASMPPPPIAAASAPRIATLQAAVGRPMTAPPTPTDERRSRPRLTDSDPVEAAPSIGPKTAARLAVVGISTIGDLLAAKPDATAKALGVRHITAADIAAWQAQTRLVMALPALSATAAQLLQGAGYDTVDAIAAAEPDRLAADILQYATTGAGERILRTGSAPDLESIKRWVASALASAAA
jgi:hypothetical protein